MEHIQNREGKAGRMVTIHGYFVPSDPPDLPPPAMFHELLVKVIAWKWWLAVPAMVLASAGVLVGLLGTPVYRATATAKLIEDKGASGNLSQLASQFGGLASLAGIRLPAATDRVEAIAVLKSAALAQAFIQRHDLQPRLFPRKWDGESRAWIAGVAPTMARTIEQFDRKVRDVHEDKMTGLVTVTMRWRDPQTAADWANELVRMTNERMRQQAVNEATASLQFLEKQVANTSNVELRQAIFRLMQDHMGTITLANARPDYALYPIDPAIAPDPGDDIKPGPVLLGLAGVLIGMVLGSAFAFLRERRPRHV
jgi:uncharacterized protein involved in exopolysaccharide biosynthesis